MAAAPRILIVGGGIAGLATALALARCGLASTVVERRAEFSEAGAGIQIGPNGVRALDALGVRAELEGQAGRPRAILVHDGASGRLLQTLPLGDRIAARHGVPYLVAHRRDLQAALLGAVIGQPLIRVTLSFELAAIEDRGDAVVARAIDGRTIDTDLLIGADGIHSLVRRHVAPTAPIPSFSGRTAARTVIPREAVIGKLDTGATGVWLAPRSHVVHYPVRGGAEIAIVVIREEGWHEPDWSGDVAEAAVMASLRGYTPRLRQSLALATEWRRWALFEAPPLPHWSRGRVTLAGDAAHPILPFLAQGASLALEDALTLAGAIAGTGTDLAASLPTYEASRRQRADAVVRQSRRNGRIYHLDGLAAQARNLALGVLPAGRFMAAYDWIYRWRPPAAAPQASTKR